MPVAVKRDYGGGGCRLYALCAPLLGSGDEKQHPPGRTAGAGAPARFPPAHGGFLFFPEGISHVRDSSDERHTAGESFSRGGNRAGNSRVIRLLVVHDNNNIIVRTVTVQNKNKPRSIESTNTSCTQAVCGACCDACVVEHEWFPTK